MSQIFRKKILPAHQYPTVCIMCNSLMLIRELLAFLMGCCWRESLWPAWAQWHRITALPAVCFGLIVCIWESCVYCMYLLDWCISLTGDRLCLCEPPASTDWRVLAEPNLTLECPQDLALTAGKPVFRCALSLIGSRTVTLTINGLLLSTSNCHRLQRKGSQYLTKLLQCLNKVCLYRGSFLLDH